MALALGGLGLSLSASTGWARSVPNSQTLHLAVGHTEVVSVGNGRVFVVGSCTSALPNVVPCQLPSAVPHDVQAWCLSATASPVNLTIGYVPIGSANPIGSFTLKVNCKAAAIPKILVLHSRTVTPLQSVTQVGLNSCTTNVLGAQCITQDSQIIESCSLAVTANALPITVTANVTVDGAPAINGKTMTLQWKCAY